MDRSSTNRLQTELLEIAYVEYGNASGEPILLLHGFPDHARAWDTVGVQLGAHGYRALAPYLRGVGPTRFRDDAMPRSGQVAALAEDAIEFADRLGLDRFVLVGHDCGAQAAQAVAALHPERVTRLVSMLSYAIAFGGATPPLDQVRALWYQWLFNLDLGRTMLEADRRRFCRYLWQTWSPTWRFSEAEFDAVAPSFDNPDFVAVTIHRYRHPFGNAAFDPRYAVPDAALAAGPPITVPTLLLQGADDGVDLVDAIGPDEARHFTGGYERRVVDGAGHFLPRERPDAVVDAVLGRA